MDWYERAIIEEGLTKEASAKKYLLLTLLSLMSGTSAYFEAQAIRNFLSRKNISEQKIMEEVGKPQEPIENLTRQDIVSTLEEYNVPQETYSEKPITQDDLIRHILQHEGLIEKQTPFRYTNETMKKWDTIHGFEIDKTTPVPFNRRNFIFLKNPSDVPMAVKKQFENYLKKPSKYGLPKNPTLEDAIRVFDQSGADSKIQYLKEALPSIKPQDPLSKFFPIA